MDCKDLVGSSAQCAIASGTARCRQQTKLKWAHVYETSEPYHKWSVWAAGEIEKRTNGSYHIDVFPASSLGKESDLNQGLTLGTVDMIISGAVVRRAQPCRGSASATTPTPSATATT